MLLDGLLQYDVDDLITNCTRTAFLFAQNDKAKIKKVIEELDEKKKETLKVTWVKVNK